ncbi:MAG: glutathione S-transferase N-terminal domain-containing protein [Pseudomonadota bacterium]
MKLYFSPLACSMATRIALYETGEEADFIAVDLGTKRAGEEDFLTISPLGYVPALKTDDGKILTENAAILQYVGRRRMESGLVPRDDPALALLQQWLCFISSELHAGVFSPLFSRESDDAVKAHALKKAASRFTYLDHALQERDTLLDRFTVADAYLFTVVNWAQATPIKLQQWKEVSRYHAATSKRPSVARALAAEVPLYRA